jgi:LysM repeat protein
MSGAPKLVRTLCGFPVSAPCTERSPLGCHRKQSRIRIARRLPAAAAVPALAGAAAAFAMSPQALADPSAAHSAASHAVVTDAATRLDASSAQLLSAVKQQAAQHQARSAQASSYTVRSGDSLSAIAERVYHNQNAWPVLYWANTSQIHWANDIDVGQVLRVPVEPARIPAAPTQLGPAPAPAAAAQVPPATQASAPAASQASAPAASQAPATAQSTEQASYSGGTPGGSFGQCVVARESGGNAQVMNSTGHYGLYQFSASTWAAYGGNPADFGNASAAEQNQVFANALAAGGQSNWSAYDGC